MADRNPYENGVDIPDFVETNEEDVDLSVFKMSDDELNTGTNNFTVTENEDDDDFDDEDDDEPKRKLSPKGVMVIGIALIVILLVTTVVGFVYGAKQHNAYKSALAQVESLNGNVASLNEQINALNAEIESLKTPVVETPADSKSGTTYKIVSGMNVRSAATTSAGYASTDSVKGISGVISNDGVVQMTAGSTVQVYETSVDGTKTWGRIGTNAWICLVNGSDVYAKAE